MENHVSVVAVDSVPRIVVTEPSPVSIQTQSVSSIVRQIESSNEDVANASGINSESVGMSFGEVAGTSEPEPGCSSGEFIPAEECNGCAVSVPEQSVSQSVDDAATTATLEPEQDDLRSAEEGCCRNYGLLCIDYYEKIWKAIHTWYAVPFWFVLFSLPMSAGFVSALYMYSCKASHSVTHLIFTVGVFLMIVITLRICLIIRRYTTTNPRDEATKMVHTLLLVSTFLTVVFFIIESVAYWRMTPSTQPGTADYCDPKFLTFSFWWNCIMCVAIIPIFLFPA